MVKWNCALVWEPGNAVTLVRYFFYLGRKVQLSAAVVSPLADRGGSGVIFSFVLGSDCPLIHAPERYKVDLST